MADANIVIFGNALGGGTIAIPDNNTTALEIDSVDAEKYITLDTTDDASKVVLLGTHTEADNESSGMVGIREATPKAPLHIVGTGGSTGMSIDPTANNSPTLFIENSSNNSKDRCNVALNTDGANGSSIYLYKSDTRRLLIEGTGSLASVSSETVPLKLTSSAGSGQYISFTTGGAERLKIDNSGAIATGGEATPLCAANGIHIFESDTGVTLSGADGADQLVIESNESDGAGLTILTDTNRVGKIHFSDEAPSGKIEYSHSTNTMSFYAFNNERLTIKSGGFVGVADTAPTSMIGVKGDLSLALSSGTVSTSGSSTTLTGSSTAFLTDFAVGSAIKVGTVTTTVTAIASDTSLTLEDAIDTGSTGTTCTRDQPLLALKSGDGKTRFQYDSLGQLTLCDTAQTNIIITDGDVVTITGSQNTIIGAEPATTITGGYNTRVGTRAGKGNSSSSTTIVGAQAGEGASAGTEVTLFGYYSGNAGPGSYCTGIGPRALSGTQSGGTYNTGLGYRAGDSITTGDRNLCLGADSDAAATLANQIAIGYEAICNTANTAVIGDSSIVLIRPGSNGNVELGNASFQFDDVFTENVTDSSDERVKEQIENTSLGLDFINRLRPVSYKLKDVEEEWGTRTSKEINEDGEEVEVSKEILIQPAVSHTRKHQGLIAQEVKAVLDEIGVDAADFGGYVDANISGGADKLALRYRQFIGPLIKAVQELTARIEVLENGD